MRNSIISTVALAGLTWATLVSGRAGEALGAGHPCVLGRTRRAVAGYKLGP